MGTFVPSFAVPAFPGAQNTLPTRGERASFHTRACSRPPLPITSTFCVMNSPDRRRTPRVQCIQDRGGDGRKTIKSIKSITFWVISPGGPARRDSSYCQDFRRTAPSILAQLESHWTTGQNPDHRRQTNCEGKSGLRSIIRL